MESVNVKQYMNKVFVGTPTKYDQNDIDYVWALCKCPSSPYYGIRIPREKGIVDYHFKCKNCGTEGVILTRKSIL